MRISRSAQISSILSDSRCEICGSKDSRQLFATKDRLAVSLEAFRIAECATCGVLRTLPEMSVDELEKFYPNDYWGGVPSEKWIQASQSDKTDFVRKCHLEGGRILDVGCGAGFFLRALPKKHWLRYGVEIGNEAANAAAQILGDENIFTGRLSQAKFADESFDTVTFWSALEHTNEPRANLLEARRIVKRGGTLIVQVPNAASYQARIFKGDWFALDAPRHRYHFTLQTLQRVLVETGFEIYLTTFHSKVHNSHALRQSLKAKLWDQSPLHRGLFLLSIPFLKPFDLFMSANWKGATMTIAARAV